MLPRARRRGLVVQRLADELLVYDRDRHRAYCLNRAAALVWRSCNGKTSIRDIATRLSRALQAPVGEDVVAWTLGRLRRARLVRWAADDPAPAVSGSRRQLVRSLGLAVGTAVLLPSIAVIVSPVPAQAASAVSSSECFSNPGAHAGKCCTSNGRRCVRLGRRGLCIGSPC